MWTWLVTGITWVAIMCNVYINVRWQQRLQGREREVRERRTEHDRLQRNFAFAIDQRDDLWNKLRELRQQYTHLKKYEPNTEWVGDEKVRDFL